MSAFHIHEHLAAAGLVLVLINVATTFPLWPGNFGLVQIAVVFPLVNYGVDYARGFAFGIGLHAIEASVALDSLLSGQFGADELRVAGPHVQATVDRDGDSESGERERMTAEGKCGDDENRRRRERRDEQSGSSR